MSLQKCLSAEKINMSEREDKSSADEKYKRGLFKSDLLIELVAFLEENSGGVPEQNVFTHEANELTQANSSVIQQFLSFDNDSDYCIYNALEDYADRIPSSSIPFAEDQFGNLLIIFYKGPRSGQIWFWDHENENDTPNAALNCNFVASNFTSFIDSLMTLDEYKASLSSDS